jgi:hypothetical protein
MLVAVQTAGRCWMDREPVQTSFMGESSYEAQQERRGSREATGCILSVVAAYTRECLAKPTPARQWSYNAGAGANNSRAWQTQ